MADLSISQVLKLAANAAFGLPVEASFKNSLPKISLSESEALHRLLSQHRLQYLVGEAVRANQLESIFPQEYARELAAEAQSARLRNAMFELALTQTTQALFAQGIHVMVCKGARLAQFYYPARGLRRMQDLDLWVAQDDFERVRAILGSLGYRERPDKASVESYNFISDAGIVLDVHVLMGLFETQHRKLSDLCVPQQGTAYQVLIPEAFVAHLLVHMLGHAAKTGILLCWIFDIVLVLRKHKLDMDQLRALLPLDGSWDVFLRLVKTFSDLGWIDDALGLDEEIKSKRVISWASVVRQRRRCGWRGLRGKARLVRSLVRGDAQVENIPNVKDFVLFPLDWLLEESQILSGRGGLLLRRAHI